MYLYTNATDIFSNVEIKGGICFFLIDNDYAGKCEYHYIDNNNHTVSLRNLGDFNLLIRDSNYAEIVKKVKDIHGDNQFVDSLVSNDTPFGISSNVKSSTKKTSDISDKKDSKHNVAIYHIEKLKRRIDYISINSISKNTQDIGKYKVFLTGAAGSGNDKIVLGKPILAEKNSVCSQSFIYAPFNSKIEAENFIKYLKTKFFRVLVASIKITQSCPNRVYQFVPIQDFTETSDITWDCTISEIDNQLFKKYSLSEDNIEYIKKSFDYME